MAVLLDEIEVISIIKSCLKRQSHLEKLFPERLALRKDSKIQKIREEIER